MKDKEEKKVYYVMLKKGSHTDLEQHKGEFCEINLRALYFYTNSISFCSLEHNMLLYSQSLFHLSISVCVCQY